MNVPADAPFVSRPASNLAAGLLALGVHGLFLLLLVFGVSWQTQHPAPVMVDLWEALPQVSRPPPEPAPTPAAAPPPPPEPVKQPEPVKVEPPPRPSAKEIPPPPPPDIALEKKKAEAEQLKKLKAIQAAEEKALADAVRAEADAMKQARDRQIAEQKRRELLQQMEEEELMQRMTEEDAAREARETRVARETAVRLAASRRQAEVASVVGEYRNQISAKVRGNTRVPEGLKGNPEVRCLVKLLPTGEVQSVKVSQSSGNPAYDDAVVRAIERSSPLPLPADRDARAQFVPELSFVHRPKE
ncbi:MAG: TonB family protein [Gammaproteobacteria bacterium]